MAQTEAQRKLIEQIQAGQAPSVSSQEAPVDSQRLRMMGQGLTLGFADEIEAAVQAALSGEVSYEQALAEIRSKINAYKKAEPMSALGYEALGSIPTALVGGAPATMGRMALRAGAEGAVAAAGQSEGDVTERIASMPAGFGLGAVAGPLASAGVSGLGSLATGTVDFARSKLGDKGASVVAREIQRIAQTTGKTPDEIIADIAEGRIMAENTTLRNVARAYYTSNSPAKATIEQGITNRPVQKRTEAIEGLQPQLTPIQGPDVGVQAEKMYEAQRKAAGEMYNAPKTKPVGDELRVELAQALERSPSAADQIQKALDAELGGAKFFEIAKREDGKNYVIFTREPTQAEAEVVRSTLADVTTSAFKAGEGTFGQAIGGVESSLREVIDRIAPEVADARTAYAIAKGNQDAFEAGTKALQGDVYKVLDQYSKLSPAAQQAFKTGFMTYLRNTATTGSSSASLVNRIANEEGKLQLLLNEMLPEQSVGQVMKSFDIAKQAQDTKNYVLGQSATAGTQEAKRGIGMGTDTIDAAARAMMGDPSGLILQARKLVAENSTIPLTDKQMDEVAEYLVTTDADYLAKVLQDDSMWAGFQKHLEKLAGYAARGGRLTGAEQIGGGYGSETGPLTIQVTKEIGAQ